MERELEPVQSKEPVLEFEQVLEPVQSKEPAREPECVPVQEFEHARAL
jgi:hypothetical protein